MGARSIRTLGWVVGIGAVFSFGCKHRPAPSKGDVTPLPSVLSSVGSLPSRAPRPGSPAASRAACAFKAGAAAADTLDHEAPLGDKIPIDHFVLVMQENRSFDHYFQRLPEFGQPDVDVAPPSYENTDPSGEGEIVKPFQLNLPCGEDVPHNWIAVHHQINGGTMTGFVAAANPKGARALGYYGPQTLPFYYALASTFAIGDHYFAALPGPTFPNRMFAQSASSFGHISNQPPPPRDEERSIYHLLEKRGLSWVIYSNAPTFEEKIYPRLHTEKGEHFRTIDEFQRDAERGTLPAFAWVESSYNGTSGNDEHAPGNIQAGQAFVAHVVASVMKSPAWPRSALFLTYDEHGGFFDHVPPPPACAPGDDSIKDSRTQQLFTTLGVRVPFVVVSPFAKAHFVSHRTYTHTSWLRLVEARFGLPALTKRDANDAPPFDMFDFVQPPFLRPPVLPEARIDAEAAKECLLLK